MKCVVCGHQTAVVNTRRTEGGLKTWRRRHCPKCGATFSTYERFELDSILKVTEPGKTAPYKRSRLFRSVLLACEHRHDAPTSAEALVNTIEAKLTKRLKGSQEIARIELKHIVHNTLKAFDPLVYTTYLAKHGQYLTRSELARKLKT